ncbi:MAG TPA: HAMP domain-containing sensor histidine kinase [Gemmatimonadales bacterium]|nr:HAMP domain-containing sensor histidine kinase [Gemmatimonadales bacterium]
MTESRLGAILTQRFDRLVWTTLAAYAVLVVLAFALVSEIGLRRSLEQSADGIESLLGLYVEPGAAPTTVAPAMLADQLLGMGDRFMITRTVSTGDAVGGPSVYFLSPTMPAKRIETGAEIGSTPDDVRRTLLQSIAERGRWRFHVLHRRAGEFDIYVAGSRGPYLFALLGLSLGALVLLPVAALAARRGANRTVARALTPLGRVVAETQDIGPRDLSRRVGVPTGLAEVTGLADAINMMIDRVESSHQALEAFTADASHELRTPLTHLRAQVQWALAEGRSAEEIAEALAATGREVDRMSRMVEDLLLIARGENRQLAIERQPFDLAQVVREVEEITADMAAGEDITVRAELDGPLQAIGDPARTRQILLNLAANAVRYTKRGSITFTFAREAQMAGVHVTDTGEGIAPELCTRIFDRFYRVESSRSRAHGGGGLGLTIAQLLAKLQDGRIDVTSEPGQGSTFSLWLPAAELEGR